MSPKIIAEVRNNLLAAADEQTKLSGQRFFKEPVLLYGVKSVLVHKISKQGFAHIKHLPKTEIWELCEQLWQSGYNEEAVVAALWADYLQQQYEAQDMDTFERWVGQYVSNWAACDTLCNHPVGTLVTMYPEQVERLKTWAKAKDNRWLRRAAAVSLIIPARKGLFLSDIFEIADTLLKDDDDLVQKGYGWMLKAASEAHQKAVFDYIMQNKAVMPRTALRYAIEKMPPDMRKAAMQR